KAWGERLTRGDAEARREFEQLTERAQVGDVAPEIETVDAVSDPSALSRAAYSALFDGLREQGLPDTAETYIRDLDAGRRTDRPSAGDGHACRQVLDRLTEDADWRQRYLSGDLAARKLAGTLSRIIAFAADDGKPITREVADTLSALGLR